VVGSADVVVGAGSGASGASVGTIGSSGAVVGSDIGSGMTSTAATRGVMIGGSWMVIKRLLKIVSPEMRVAAKTNAARVNAISTRLSSAFFIFLPSEIDFSRYWLKIRKDKTQVGNVQANMLSIPLLYHTYG
jgi:hypothetical protein